MIASMPNLMFLVGAVFDGGADEVEAAVDVDAVDVDGAVDVGTVSLVKMASR